MPLDCRGGAGVVQSRGWEGRTSAEVSMRFMSPAIETVFVLGRMTFSVLTLRAASFHETAKTDGRGLGQSQTPSLGSSQVLVAQSGWQNSDRTQSTVVSASKTAKVSSE